MGGTWDAHEYGDRCDTGGEIFAKTAKTPPLQPKHCEEGIVEHRPLVVVEYTPCPAFAIIVPPPYLCLA